MKKLLFLLLPILVFASDIKFAVAASLGEEAKNYGASLADVIDEKLGIKTIRNFESTIYEDEAALYAVKNGLVKFALIRCEVTRDMGLRADEEYGFDSLARQNEFCLVAQSRYINSIERTKRDKLLKALKKLN